MAKTLFTPESLVTGGFRSQFRADAKFSVEHQFFFDDCTDSGYCLDAPEAMSGGAMVSVGMGKPSCTIVYRKDN